MDWSNTTRQAVCLGQGIGPNKAISFPDLLELTSLKAQTDIIQIISLCLSASVCHAPPHTHTYTHTQLLRKSTGSGAVEVWRICEKNSTPSGNQERIHGRALWAYIEVGANGP